MPTEPPETPAPGAERDGDERTPPIWGEDAHGRLRAPERAALIGLIQADYPGSWSKPTGPHAEQIAARILRAGFVRERGFWGCNCPSCLASIGNCPRCGQLDLVPELGVCGPCAGVLEAEASRGGS